ncbi:MAG: hypothetical protein JST82_12600 [Bacteroidetes bacterium]|nr:hypothetical protein [Bacteroidota bacterium]
MKKFIAVLLLLAPFIISAQTKAPPATFDIRGCYEYALHSLVNSDNGLGYVKKDFGKKVKHYYFPKKFYTVALSETIDKSTLKYIDFDLNKETLYEEQESKKAALILMTELNLTADTCDLWFIPMKLTKKDNGFETTYSDNVCHVYFYFNKETNKLGYAKTECEGCKND